MKQFFRVSLCAISFVMALCANQAAQVDLAKKNLSNALSTFEELRDSGLLGYSVEINKKRFQDRLNLIAKSSKTLSKDKIKDEDLQSSHKDASQAIIGIRGLKTAGSIYYNTKKARLLYLSGFKSLRDAVLGLYELKSKDNTRELATLDHAQQSRFVVSKETSYSDTYTVTTFDPSLGVVTKNFKGYGPVRYALNFVMFKEKSFNDVCVAVSYLDASSSFNSKSFKCNAIFLSSNDDQTFQALDFGKDEITTQKFDQQNSVK
ncbi:MAG: hypothetical protein KC646_00490 [Candidatus Cloacimonetes bacterium]|nr:hypothetical protein [Candidatus Cloacimonadota bacterium]